MKSSTAPKMISSVQKYCIFCALLFSLPSGDTYSLTCKEGNSVSFECPCPEEFNDCRLKKLFERGYIVRDGVLVDHHHHHHRYKLNDLKTHITLKECNETDKGTYVWMCGRSNTNMQFHLEVTKVQVTNRSLKCSVGEKVSFEHTCPQALDFCSFRKVEQEEFIVHGGVVINPGYEFTENKTDLILKECGDDDEGTYLMTCGKCNESIQFHLEVEKPKPIPEATENKRLLLILIWASVLTGVSALLILICINKRQYHQKLEEIWLVG